MTTETVADRRAEDISSEERWNAWIVRGLEYDRQLRKRAIIGATALVVVVALGLFLTR